MCKYCECKVDETSIDKDCRGADIVEIEYLECYIKKMDNGEYTIYAAGDFDGWSEAISFCPFCGRKLKE